jgi:hypothetical protein
MATISRHGKGWRVQIRRKGHPPLSETFPLRKQAEAWAAQRESEIVQGKLGLLPKHTLAEALAKFREEKARNRWEVNRIKVLERDTIAKVPLASLELLAPVGPTRSRARPRRGGHHGAPAHVPARLGLQGGAGVALAGP